LDITIGEDEQVFFKVSGTHTVYLTGNYVIPANDSSSRIPDYDSDEDEEYDLSPDEDELDEDEESDELDDIDNPRITEVDSDDEEEVPKLVKAKKDNKQKGKNKRPAEDSEDETPNLDDIIAKSIKPAEPKENGEQKLSKRQLKKLKNNAGVGVPKTTETKNNAGISAAKAVETKTTGGEKPTKDNPTSSKGDKKVQFAKDLEQGPVNPSTKSESNSDKVRTVQGVKIEDKVIGEGPVAKKGSKVSMRYIGKFLDGKQFDGMW
jgi:FK506-binding nuclear protein